jgi:hypothetical protein
MLSKVSDKEYIMGDYKITLDGDYWLISKSPEIKTRVVDSVRCSYRDDAFRIAMFMTSERLVHDGLKEMMGLAATEAGIDPAKLDTEKIVGELSGK